MEIEKIDKERLENSVNRHIDLENEIKGLGELLKDLEQRIKDKVDELHLQRESDKKLLKELEEKYSIVITTQKLNQILKK